ncbi:conjugative relaxase (plasmid) [Moraxella bovis]|uniref:MobF family relaxase n=1 Tax=Moraxella bovis TaxID=476 RepID=UPI0022263BB4|nr:MobF family relaxase [Moraxella bovis]UZA18150.1 conjugative relaxase [Moraxella bovis]
MISSQLITRQSLGGDKQRIGKAIDSYYQEEKDDYYTRDKQPSEWYGQLANELGLKGEMVKKEDFAQLLEGKFKGETLRDSNFKGKSAKDRLGLDLTFNAPKSVSIQALVAGDTRLIQAHNEAVKESLKIIESNAQARQKIKSKSRVENTNNLAVALFRHETNRNLDPHLHTHSVVLNITKRKDGAFRALHNDKIMKSIGEASQAYQTNLAKKCKELGYDIKINDNGTFELAHISREQIMQFSTRGRQIEEALAQKGLTRETATTEQKQIATLDTRQRKKSIDTQIVRESWQKTAKKLGLEKILSPKILKEKANERSFGISHTDHQREPTKTTSQATTKADSVYELPSGNVANPTRQGSEVLLSDNEQLELHQQRTNTDRGLRWRSNGFGGIGKIVDIISDKLSFSKSKNLSDTKNMEDIRTLDSVARFGNNKQSFDKESLREVWNYEPPSSDLTDEWKEIANGLNINFEQGQVYTDEHNKEFSGDKLMKLVIDHLVDKKVDLTHDEIIKETLIKGLGEIDYNEANRLLDKFIANGDLVKAQTLYKAAGDKNNDTAKTVGQWVNIIIKDGSSEIGVEVAQEAVKKGIEQGRLVAIQERYVTKKDLEQERDILRLMQQGRGLKNAYYDLSTADKLLSESTLNDGQKSAARLVMTSSDRVIGIQGYAGVGKSYTLSETIKHIEAAGGKAHIFAPYGSQVKSLKADGHEANTLSRLLSSKKLQDEITTNSLIVVDEAGVIANNEMHKLLKIAQSKNAKVVLLGDTEQTKAISAGKPFDVLMANGMATATIDEIQRQKDETLKQAVYFAANNEQSKSIKTLEKSVFEIKDRTQRLDTLVTRYIELSADERKKTLIVTGTNNDKDYINYAIRKELGMAGQGVASTQLKRYDMSKAEMKHARYFKEDTLIELTHNPKNKELKMGELYKVVGKDRHLLIVEDSAGKVITFSPTSERLSVYEEKSFEVSKGDRLRVSKGNQEMGTVTGDKLIVENIKNGKIYAKDEKTGQTHTFNANQKNHLDYDYCSTVHNSQGLTVDRVLINIDTKSKTTGKEVYYVAVSRARHEAIVLTDDMAKLPTAIAKGADKYSAFEMANKNYGYTIQDDRLIKKQDIGFEK